jgi:hypothetical protein
MRARFEDIIVTWSYLDNNPNARVVFGDNLQRRGKGGAAKLREHPQAIGFITKKFPDNLDGSFYRPEEYSRVFEEELEKLKTTINSSPGILFYITKLGGGLANRFFIWEKVIKDRLLTSLSGFKNVIFCWKKEE